MLDTCPIPLCPLSLSLSSLFDVPCTARAPMELKGDTSKHSVFDRKRLGLVNGQCISRDQRQLKHDGLPAHIQVLLPHLTVHHVNVWQKVASLLQRRFFYEPRANIWVRCWDGLLRALHSSIGRREMQQAPLRSIGESLVYRQIAG